MVQGLRERLMNLEGPIQLRVHWVLYDLVRLSGDKNHIHSCLKEHIFETFSTKCRGKIANRSCLKTHRTSYSTACYTFLVQLLKRWSQTNPPWTAFGFDAGVGRIEPCTNICWRAHCCGFLEAHWFPDRGHSFTRLAWLADFGPRLTIWGVKKSQALLRNNASSCLAHGCVSQMVSATLKRCVTLQQSYLMESARACSLRHQKWQSLLGGDIVVRPLAPVQKAEPWWWVVATE